MGYSAEAVIVFGTQIPTPKSAEGNYDTEELKRIANIFFPSIDFADVSSHDEFYDEIMGGIRIVSGYPYQLKQYNNGGYEAVWCLVLDEIDVPIYPNSGPIITQIEPPSPEEVDIFVNFLRSNGISYSYSQFLVISGG